MTNFKKILIIDDEINIRDSLAEFLDDFGMETRKAGTGEDGLNLLKMETFDVAIVDLRLPGMSGETFIIKAVKLYPQLKFIIHTGSVVYSLPGELADVGIGTEDVFVKPVTDMTVFYNAIGRLTSD